MKRTILTVAAAILALGGTLFAIHAVHSRSSCASGQSASGDCVCPFTGKVICPKKCPQDCAPKPEPAKPQE